MRFCYYCQVWILLTCTQELNHTSLGIQASNGVSHPQWISLFRHSCCMFQTLQSPLSNAAVAILGEEWRLWRSVYNFFLTVAVYVLVSPDILLNSILTGTNVWSSHTKSHAEWSNKWRGLHIFIFESIITHDAIFIKQTKHIKQPKCVVLLYLFHVKFKNLWNCLYTLYMPVWHGACA